MDDKQKRPDHATEIAERARVRASQRWGVGAAEFLAALNGKMVIITTIDSKVYTGTLIGVDIYDLLIKTPAGATVLVTKGSIKTVAAATNGTTQSS
jgi:hypothetical protein